MKTITLGNLDFAHAKQPSDVVPLSFAKVLIQKPIASVASWVVNSVQFKPEDCFDNQSGELVKLH